MQRVYALAAQIKQLLYQLPCYCHCDREMGHKSLDSCYRERHGSHCSICQQELFYAYEQTTKGKGVTEIRSGIIRGDWNDIDLKKWAPPGQPGSSVAGSHEPERTHVHNH
jgi:hypothetical protein